MRVVFERRTIIWFVCINKLIRVCYRIYVWAHTGVRIYRGKRAEKCLHEVLLTSHTGGLHTRLVNVKTSEGNTLIGQNFTCRSAIGIVG